MGLLSLLAKKEKMADFPLGLWLALGKEIADFIHIY